MTQVSQPIASTISPNVPSRSGRERRHWIGMIGLVLFAAVIYLPQLSGTRLFDQDEGYYASVAMEMHQRNDWILPTFNQELFAHKPPLMFWGMRLGYLVMGLNEAGARIGSALAGILTVIVVSRIGRHLFDSQVGLFAGLAMASCLMFSMVARSATADAYLTLFIAASLGTWMAAYRGIDPSMGSMARLKAISRVHWLQIYGWIGLALLTKGPIGFLFPVTIIGLSVYSDLACEAYFREQGSKRPSWRTYLLCAVRPLHPREIVRAVQAVNPMLGLVCLGGIAAPWYVFAEVQSGGQFLQEFIGVHHLGRFSHAMDNHEGPFFYYVVACLIGMYPWSAFAIPIGIAWIRALRTSGGMPERRWITVWMLVYIAVFSIASTKLPNYVLPAYPAFALCTGYYLREAYRFPQQWNRWQTIAWLCLVAVGGLVSIGTAIASWIGSSGEEWVRRLGYSPTFWDLLGELWWLGLPLIGSGIVGLIFQRSSYANWLPFGFAASAAMFLSLLWHVAAPKLHPFQAPQRLSQEANLILGKTPRRVFMMDLFRPSVLFYSERPVDFTGTRAFLERRSMDGNSASRDAELLLLRSVDWEWLQRELPGEYRVLLRVPDFPEMGELIAVGNAALLSEEK